LALKPLFGSARRRTYASARLVLATTERAAEQWPSERTSVLPLGIAVDRFTPSPLPERSSILFLGGLTVQKGVRELLEAFAQVRTRVRDAKLVVAGDGPEREWLTERARALGLNGSFELLGHVEHERIPTLL